MENIIIAILGSGALFTFIQFIINRHDNKNEKLDKIIVEIDDIKRLATRTQLMTLISDYPKRKEEIMKVAKLYFVNMKGNFYLTTLFKEWCKKHRIKTPYWVKDNI